VKAYQDVVAYNEAYKVLLLMSMDDGKSGLLVADMMTLTLSLQQKMVAFHFRERLCIPSAVKGKVDGRCVMVIFSIFRQQ